VFFGTFIQATDDDTDAPPEIQYRWIARDVVPIEHERNQYDDDGDDDDERAARQAETDRRVQGTFVDILSIDIVVCLNKEFIDKFKRKQLTRSEGSIILLGRHFACPYNLLIRRKQNSEKNNNNKKTHIYLIFLEHDGLQQMHLITG
jgi:hypothetical protein